ncbi:MAG: ATP-binding cassette domain-containing protein [Eubacterium sp.]|nr:ATP-binding cassette domain-containing protein [Eubacterium sp.]
MLELKNICYSVDGKDILKDVNLKIDDRFVAITGPNGSGKSTLLKIIMGLVQPSSGKILLDGEDITEKTTDERARLGVSLAFQQPVRFKGLKVRDLLNLAIKNSEKKYDWKTLYKLLDDVGLSGKEYIDRELDDTLSGGEMKRIEIAMIAARETKLTLFDEPEAGIDLWSFQNLIEVFERLHRDTEGNIMIISHQERILAIADKIVYLKEGKVQHYDEREKIIKLLEISGK